MQIARAQVAAAVLVTACATPALAQTFDYELIVSREEAVGPNGSDPTFDDLDLGGFGVVPGGSGELFASLSDFNSLNGRLTRGTPGSAFTVDVNGPALVGDGFNGDGFTSGGTLPYDGSAFFFTDLLQSQVVRYTPGSPTGGNVDLVASKADIQQFTGGSNALFSAFGAQTTLPNGDLLAYERVSDSLLRFTSAGGISTFLSDTDLAGSVVGSDDIEGVTLVGNTLVFGSGSGDGLFSLDLDDPAASNIVQIFDPTDLAGVLGGDDGDIDFRDIQLGADGLVYALEDDYDTIFRFDLSDPTNTLTRILSSDDLANGAANTSLLSGLVPYGDSIAFYTIAGNSGLYQVTTVIPEPTALAGLVAIGAPLLLRRRRA